MQFCRSKFYHWRAQLPRLDLAKSGCETQFSNEKRKKRKGLNAENTEEGGDRVHGEVSNAFYVLSLNLKV